MSPVLCCLDSSSCAGEVLYLGDAYCMTWAGAGLRLSVLEYKWSEVLHLSASQAFIPEEFGALLKGKLLRARFPSLVMMWFASPYLWLYLNRAIFAFEVVWKFGAARLAREAAGSCDHIQVFWDGLLVASVRAVLLAALRALSDRTV